MAMPPCTGCARGKRLRLVGGESGSMNGHVRPGPYRAKVQALWGSTMSVRGYDQKEAAGLAALGRAVLQVIDELPDYPSDPQVLKSVEDHLRFAIRLTESLSNKLADRSDDKDWARQLLFDREWRFTKPEPVDPASLGPDEVPF